MAGAAGSRSGARCESAARSLLPWGSEAERRAAPASPRRSRRARADRRPLDEMARLIAGASFVVGVDTGLLHLAAALGVPLVAIFVGSEPGLTGPIGRGSIAVVGGKGQVPSVAEVMSALERSCELAPAALIKTACPARHESPRIVFVAHRCS